MSRVFPILLLMISASLPEVFADDERPRVALMDFAYQDRPAGLSPDATTLTLAVHAALADGYDFNFVERQALESAFNELALGLSGIASGASSVRAGNLVGADMFVRGQLSPTGDDEISLDLAVVDPRRADLLATESLSLARDRTGSPVIDTGTVNHLATEIAGLLKSGTKRLETITGKKVVAPLFFQNTGPHDPPPENLSPEMLSLLNGQQTHQKQTAGNE